MKSFDQCADDPAIFVSSTAEQRITNCFKQRQVFNPLSCPICRDLVAWNSPNLFRVGFKKDFVEPFAEAVRYPLLKACLIFMRKQTGLGVTEAHQRNLDRSEAGKRIECLERVVEKMIIVIDS